MTDAGADIEALEAARLAALFNCDLEAAHALHAEDYELITPGGVATSRDEYLELLRSGTMRYTTFEAASPVRIRRTPSMAVVRYQARIEVRYADGSKDGGLYWHTDIWQLEAAGWRAVWSHATRIRTPD